jgi:formylglycine-generating enzyme required for sulfatase activity
MRSALASLLLILLSGCSRLADCRPGTLFVAYAVSEGLFVDAISVSIVTDASAQQSTVSSSLPQGSIEVLFPHGYPRGQTVTITLRAMNSGAEVGSASRDVTLADNCESLSLTIEGVASGQDLAAADLAASDGGNVLGGDLAVCTENSTRCQGNVQQRCMNNAWVDDKTCAYWCSGVACVEPASCVGMASTCGPATNEQCCASPVIPATSFKRSYDGVTTGYTDPGFPATVSSFRLDRFEVTVGRFRRFIAAGGGTQQNPPAAGSGAHPGLAGSGWDPSWNAQLAVDQTSLLSALACDPSFETWKNSAGTPAQEALPMDCVSWYEAFAFCIWDGGWLPTEAEWNAAAAAGAEQRVYPFGASIDSSFASYDCTGDGSAAGSCAATDLLIVGTRSPKGDGKWGHADLSGNVAEPVLDWFGSYPVPCTDCAQLVAPAGMTRVLRGGSYSNASSSVLASYRGSLAPSGRGAGFGIRCARGL